MPTFIFLSLRKPLGQFLLQRLRSARPASRTADQSCLSLTRRGICASDDFEQFSCNGCLTRPVIGERQRPNHLIRILEKSGEREAAELALRLGSKVEVARELCYRLYTLCDRRKRAKEAMSYNGLVQSWPEIQRLTRDADIPSSPEQGELI